MKILWFTSAPAQFSVERGGYNGGGWIRSLEKEFRKRSDLSLRISYFVSNLLDQQDSVHLPIFFKESIYEKINGTFYPEEVEKRKIAALLKVIDNFSPDVIHIFGTEDVYGRLVNYTKIPIVIHIQGIIGPYINAFFPPGFHLFRFVCTLKASEAFRMVRNYKIFRNNELRERNIYKHAKYLMGRTEWDRCVANILAPQAEYFHCDEVLREEFYLANSWNRREKSTITLISTISKVPYKGLDLILKTARLLSSYSPLSFRWVIYGITEYKSVEKMTGIRASDVNVYYGGVIDCIELISALQVADLFVHPSYIDNSPNSVCEAQLIGIPVISTNVGGISSLIKDGVNGLLVPANDPFTLYKKIIDIAHSNELAVSLGKQGRMVAQDRHSRNKIVNRNIEIYRQIISGIHKLR
jgi:glycosyltransferase involved in cell wall biosynthesis